MIMRGKTENEDSPYCCPLCIVKKTQEPAFSLPAAKESEVNRDGEAVKKNEAVKKRKAVKKSETIAKSEAGEKSELLDDNDAIERTELLEKSEARVSNEMSKRFENNLAEESRKKEIDVNEMENIEENNEISLCKNRQQENIENGKGFYTNSLMKSASEEYFLINCVLCKRKEEVNDPLQLLSPLDIEYYDDCSLFF